MASADQDYCELTVSIINYFTGKPYVDTGIGQWSRNIPVESITLNDVMYEPKAQQMSTATVTFPTVVQNQSLVPLLSLVKEGDRVELYNFQPDCGLPVFAGFIPPGGITVEMGRMILSLQDCMGRGQWERIRPYEDFDTDALGYYTRAMHRWQDYLNEDFNLAQSPTGVAGYTTMYSMSGMTSNRYVAQGKWHIGPNDSDGLASSQSGSPVINFVPGQRVLIEARGQTQTDFVAGGAGIILSNIIKLTNGGEYVQILEQYTTDTGTGTGNINRMIGVQAQYNSINTESPLAFESQANGNLPIGGLPLPANNLYALIITCETDANGVPFLSASAFVNYVNVVPLLTNIYPVSLNGWYFSISGSNTGTGNTYQEWYNIRVRQLVPWLLPASQFNPQTTDATEFQANNDDLYTFLNNFVEIDFAEYRPIYQRWPQLDLLALDGVGLVGQNASQALGMDLLTDQSAPRVSGTPMGIDAADFTNEPTFRFEEGWNLADFPQIQKSQLTHANNIVRMGSGNTDAQNFYDRWNSLEVGNPFGATFSTITGAAPTYPYFEALINDDRTSLPDVIDTLAKNDLIVRGGTQVPSLSLTVNEDIRWGFKYRAGDFVRVKTKSLIPNVDEDLRIMSITHQAGSPSKSIIVGRLPYDPTMRGAMAKSMVESWLYTQTGAGQLVLIYPFVPILLHAGGLGNTFQIPLNQFTSSTAITYASFHWFTNGTDPVADIAIAISGNDPTLATASLLPTAANGQDSGLQNALGYFPGPGTYYCAPKNTGGSDRTVNSMFLVVKIKE